MPLLSSSIVKHQLATTQEVEDALARQSAYGGDLLTNLLEILSLSEERVAAVLSESFGLEAAPLGELPRPAEHVRRLVPAEVAQRYACLPLEETAGALALAVSEPLPPEVESDLGFALGVTIVQKIAPLVRVRQAVARDYGVPLDPRIARALARLEGHSHPTPSDRLPGAAAIPERPPTVAPGPIATAPAPAEPTPAALPNVAEPAPAPSGAPTATPSVRSRAEVRALVRAARAEAPKARRLGPYTAAMAERDLLAASERDEVLRAFFDFAEQYFEYAALFAVHADLAEGRDAHGPGASRAKVQSIGVPLDLPSVLATARDAKSHSLVRLGGSGLDAALAKDLERRPGRLVLLLPIRVRGRAVLILYGDHGDQDLDLSSVGDVISFAPLVASAVERLIVQKKRGRADTGLGSLGPRRPAKSLPSPTERAEALASVLGDRTPGPAAVERLAPAPSAPPRSSELPRPIEPEPHEPEPHEPEPQGPATAREPSPLPVDLEPEAPATVLSVDAMQASTAPDTTREAFGAELEPKAEPEPKATELERDPFESVDPAEPTVLSEPPGSMPPSAAMGRPVAPRTALEPVPTRSSAPPRSIEEALARPVIAVGARPSERPTDPPEAADKLVARRIQSLPPHAVDAGWEELAGGRPPFGRKEGGTRPGVGSLRLPDPPRIEETPDISVESGPVDDDLSALVAEGGYDDLETPGVPLASTSRVDSHSARPLPARADSTELKLPTVIVDVAQDCKTLLEQLLTGDASAGERLVQAGASAVPVLVAAFPGPIEAPSSRRASSGPPRASECGPVLKALARIGLRSVPFLVVRTNDADPQVRSYATRLLGEIPSPESAHAVARRFFDGDVEVRRAALAAARLLTNVPDSISVLVADLGITAEDRGRPTALRLTAMEMLAELRQPQAVPYLVLALTDNPIDIAQAARRALVILARQDFGTAPGSWTDWWRASSGRHRIEWLIDALTHESPDIRRAAGEELKALTREYFGYYDDLPPAERVQAQQKYRQWWETRGKARFRS